MFQQLQIPKSIERTGKVKYWNNFPDLKGLSMSTQPYYLQELGMVVSDVPVSTHKSELNNLPSVQNI